MWNAAERMWGDIWQREPVNGTPSCLKARSFSDSLLFFSRWVIIWLRMLFPTCLPSCFLLIMYNVKELAPSLGYLPFLIPLFLGRALFYDSIMCLRDRFSNYRPSETRRESRFNYLICSNTTSSLKTFWVTHSLGWHDSAYRQRYKNLFTHYCHFLYMHIHLQVYYYHSKGSDLHFVCLCNSSDQTIYWIYWMNEERTN